MPYSRAIEYEIVATCNVTASTPDATSEGSAHMMIIIFLVYINNTIWFWIRYVYNIIIIMKNKKSSYLHVGKSAEYQLTGVSCSFRCSLKILSR